MKKQGLKKTLISLLSICLAASMLTGCEMTEELSSPKTTKANVSLNVTTTWSGKNVASQNYQKFIKAFTTTTGITIIDSSETADETFKQRVQTDFLVGAEPDVMYYFTGTDSDSFIKAGKVVSIEEIREVYPEYANNIEEMAFPISSVDGKCYSVPTVGYWEAMYVNTAVCEAAGIEIPNEDTSWEEFLDMCEKVKKAGFSPIAASIASEPHYWFEYLVFNESIHGTQALLPENEDDLTYQAWLEGLEEFRELYIRGYFSEKCLYSDDSASFEEFLNDEAAFCLNGSWMIATILQQNLSSFSKYTVTFVPGKNTRKTTDMIGGFSSGWYISRKAWEDPDKREAAVQLVEYMTQTSVVESFASISLGSTALKSKPQYKDSSSSRVQKDAVEMLTKKTSLVPAVQDKLSTAQRAEFMDQIQYIASGKITAEEVLERLTKGE